MLNVDGFRLIKPSRIHTQKISRQERQAYDTRATVLKVITDNDSITTQEIVKLTGFAASTVYRVTGKLAAEKSIVESLGDRKGRYGNVLFSAVKGMK